LKNPTVFQAFPPIRTIFFGILSFLEYAMFSQGYSAAKDDGTELDPD
jgi:hypothetical protein